MDTTEIIFLLLGPTAIFVSAYTFGSILNAARMSGAQEGVPSTRRITPQQQRIFSILPGFFLSLIFATLLFLIQGYSIQLIFHLGLLCLLMTVSNYLGFKLGWRRSSSGAERLTPLNQSQPRPLPEHILAEDLPDAIRITIHTQKKWGWFVVLMIQFVILYLCLFPVVGFGFVSFLLERLPPGLNILGSIIVVGIVLLILYTKFQETLEPIFDREIIEINHSTVKVEKYSSGFESMGLKKKRVYSSENVHRLTAWYIPGDPFPALRRLSFASSHLPGFILFHRSGLIRIRYLGRTVDRVDAQSLLKTIYNRYPQYAG